MGRVAYGCKDGVLTGGCGEEAIRPYMRRTSAGLAIRFVGKEA